ncbi:hypothetical protein SVIOM74S_02619 [Streptomyces violarus]
MGSDGSGRAAPRGHAAPPITASRWSVKLAGGAARGWAKSSFRVRPVDWTVAARAPS